VVRRSGRRRAFAAALGVVCAGIVLSASATGVSARPAVVIEQAKRADPFADALAPTRQGLGSHPSVSGDGRLVAYQGLPGDGDPAAAAAAGDTRTSTIYLTDRAAGETVEITGVPQGVRAGNSINPVLSGDGCNIVVVTELTLDVFRDDDTGDRWDVYRLRLPECGGTDGAWELVSTRSDGSALARDDVSTIDPPAVSRAGTLIAYTHPAAQLFDAEGLTEVTLVDLQQAINSPDRSTPVAGTPIKSPDTQFVHAGIDQPAISGDGRFVAYRSDASSTDAVPGWGAGQVAGGPATRQIFVWDRDEPDPFSAVHLLSVRTDGQPTATGASDPTISRDGRVVAFASSDVGLVPAVFPACAGGCPTQVFRVDRDTDENNWYDEPNRTAVTMVSSVSGSNPVVAGTAPSSQPALTADGQLVAFITKAPNLQLVKASGGGEPNDGDLLVADADLGTLRRVTMLAGGVQPAVGAHSGPQLSDTGRTTVFDTLAGPQLIPGGVAGRQVVTTTTLPALALAEADLGSTLVGLTSDEWYVAVINNGPTTFTPNKITVSDPRFVVNQNTSTCALGVPVPAGADCTVRITFTPTTPGPATAELKVSENGFQGVSVSTTVRGSGGEPTLRTDPAGADLGDVVIGESSAEIVFDVQNISLFPAAVSAVRISGSGADDFAVTSDSCRSKLLNPRSTCSVGIAFAPTTPGHRSALVIVETTTGQYTTMVASGDGRFAARLAVDPVVVDAGSDFVAGGSGFPPDAEVSVFFDDDPANIVTALTTGEGWFYATVPVDFNERGGPRTVVAQAADGTAASATIEVREQFSAEIGMPGFGLG